MAHSHKYSTIEDIALDAREELSRHKIDQHGMVWTKYPPAMILFGPIHYKFKPFPGFGPRPIPIFPSEVRFGIHDRNSPKTLITSQKFALVVGYGFTDHKGQGQTITYVIVDVGPTQQFSVDAFAAYMAFCEATVGQ
jgi:hypothetical protein